MLVGADARRHTNTPCEPRNGMVRSPNHLRTEFVHLLVLQLVYLLKLQYNCVIVNEQDI
jgi:hypothetical protein